MNKSACLRLVRLILVAHPAAQAIYLYGSWDTGDQRYGSDIDIAVLLPHDRAKRVDSWEWLLLAADVASVAQVKHADLVNLRRVDTTFQAEILRTGRLIHCADEEARLHFETVVLSMYQKLNEERAGIRAEIIRSGRVLA